MSIAFVFGLGLAGVSGGILNELNITSKEEVRETPIEVFNDAMIVHAAVLKGKDKF